MEIYDGKLAFQVLEAKPTLELQRKKELKTAQQTREIAVANSKAVESIKKGEVLRYKRHTANGDNLILRRSYQYILEKPSTKDCLEPLGIRLETCIGGRGVRKC